MFPLLQRGLPFPFFFVQLPDTELAYLGQTDAVQCLPTNMESVAPFLPFVSNPFLMFCVQFSKQILAVLLSIFAQFVENAVAGLPFDRSGFFDPSSALQQVLLDGASGWQEGGRAVNQMMGVPLLHVFRSNRCQQQVLVAQHRGRLRSRWSLCRWNEWQENRTPAPSG